MIDGYFQALQAALAASPAVRLPEVTLSKRSSYVGYVRGNVYFVDGSLLHFREFVNLQGGLQRYTYAFHYQSADGQLVFRYDDAAHYPDLPNAPHHKHAGHEDQVLPATPPDLSSVLQEIEALIAADL